MNIKLLYILGACSLTISTTVFAFTDPADDGSTPLVKGLTIQKKYEEYGDGGNHVKNAYNGYQNLDPNQQDKIKDDEVQHRKNIYNGRVDSGYYKWVKDDTDVTERINRRNERK